MPLTFIPNKGQVDGPAVFYVPGKDKTIYFATEGLTFVLRGQREATPERWVVKLDFVGSNPEAVPTSVEESGAVISYFKGQPDAWQTGLSASSRIIYRELWPGIDLVYQGAFDRLKYEFVVRPGADPAKIRLAVRGAKTFGRTADGRLKIQTPAGGFEDDVPVAYQEIGGVRREVPISYDLDTKRYGFSVGRYDRGQTLVIDPSSFVYCGVIGGGSNEQGRAIAVDSEGCAYITGWTGSQSAFPVIVGPDLTPNGSFSDLDAFVAKVNAAGTALVYCGFIGGSESDGGYGIAVDGWGNAYVAGTTLSSEASFPVLIGPDLTYNNGEFYGDAFVAKVDASGTFLDYCGYIGGSKDDLGRAIAVDAAGSAYITGGTQSDESTFPVSMGPDLSFNTGTDAFVAKVDPSGAALWYCGYIGCNGGDGGDGIAIDAAGCAYVSGSTFPTLDDYGQPRLPLFPTTVGPDLTTNGGGDGFVAKVASNGSSLLYCGYIGGSSSEKSHGIALDSAGCAYVTGETSSTEATFPVKVGPDLTYHPRTGSSAAYDAFVAKVDALGIDLVYCGYIGGSGDDYGYGIAVDAAGSAYVTGETYSDQSTFPVLNGPDRNANGLTDAFVTKVLPSGAGLAYSGFIGGSSTDDGIGIAVDAAGCAYVTGHAGSHDLVTVVGPDLTPNGLSDDVLVAKVPANPVIYTPVITSLSPPSVSPYEPNFTLTVRGTDFSEGSLVGFNNDTIYETMYISDTELQAPILGNFFVGGIVPVIVGSPGGEVSNEVLFYVNNPVPVIDTVAPAYLTGGSPDSSITLQGTGFVLSSVARFNGQNLEAGMSWTGEGWAIVPESLLAQSGNASVTVFNPAPEGGTSNAWTIPVTGYTLGASPDSVTIQAGQQAVYTIQASPQLGPFDNRIEFFCGDLPRGCTKSFYPVWLTPGASPGTTTLTLTTKSNSGSAAGLLDPTAPLGPLAAGLLFLLPALWPRFFARGLTAPLPRRRWIMAGSVVCLFLMISGCGAGGGPDGETGTGTPKGTYNVRVDAKSGTMTVSTTLKLVVQ